MQYIILDLEWNTAFDKRRKEFVNEIIEFGAVKLDEQLKRSTPSRVSSNQLSKRN